MEVRADGYTLPIRWACYSHRCHELYKGTVLGLVRGALSYEHNKKVTLAAAEDYLKTFLGHTPAAVQRQQVRHLPPPKWHAWPREEVRRHLVIPSPYFVSRGFWPEVLDEFDVGHSARLGRTVVPLYDETGELAVGYLARSEKPLCENCEKCHHPGEGCRYGQARWMASQDFPKSLYLYNYAAAVRTELDFVVLVEGVGDVLKVAEAGYVAVAVLGSTLSAAQVELLAKLNKTVLIAFDNDESGQEGTDRAYDCLSLREVHCFPCEPPEQYKDIGEMPTEEVDLWLLRV
jgi:hypothetical protein